MRKLLTDYGPLVAILDADDAEHERCVEFMVSERRRLISTWPVVSEAMQVLRESLPAQRALLAMIEAGKLEVVEILAEIGWMAALMAEYHDVPMDFAAASLVAVAERENLDTVFTFDPAFRIYRLDDGRAFQIAP